MGARSQHVAQQRLTQAEFSRIAEWVKGNFPVALIDVTANEFGQDLDFLSHVSTNTIAQPTTADCRC